jgi:hypothetical protein
MMEPRDRTVLRDLASALAERAARPSMAERRELWYRHNELDASVRPLVFVDPEGSWREILPESALACRGPEERGMEAVLRRQIWTADHLDTDNVVEAEWVARKAVSSTGWGLDAHWKPSPVAAGARAFDPVIHSAADLRKLRVPEVLHDERESRRRLDAARELFDGILAVRQKGVDRVDFHLMNQYTAWRGLEQVLVDMYENPAMLHDAMTFLERAHRELLRQYVSLGLLSLNNDNIALYTSGHGYTRELPRPGGGEGSVRPQDMWSWAEAQEMAVVSPEQHEEFALAYERRLLGQFGLTGYGCCEDLTRKLDFVLTIPRLRKVSVSPWADVARCARRLGPRCILMWKPQPAHLVGAFDEAAIGSYLRRAVRDARAEGCVMEIVLRDTHTCEGRTERFDRWSALAAAAARGE